MNKHRFLSMPTLKRGIRYGLLVCLALFVSIIVQSTWKYPSKSRESANALINELESKKREESPKEDVIEGDSDIIKLARKVSSYNRTVLVTVVNNAFLPFAYSWLCNTKDMGIHKSVLVITTDSDAKVDLTRDWPELTVFHLTLDISKGNQDYSHVGYIKIMIHRTEIISYLLKAGIELLLLEFDYMWFSNPLPILQSHKDVDILLNPVSDAPGVFNGGFIYLFPTNRTVALWSKVTEMMNQLGEDLKDKPEMKRIPETKNDQVYLSELLVKKYADVRTAFLPLDRYADGKWYSMPEKKRAKIKPIVISNNWVIGNSKKMERAKKFGHWFLKEDKTCDADAVKKKVRLA